MADQSAQGLIRAILHEVQLDALANWAWTRFKETNSIDLVKLEMEQRPEYKARFAGRLARVAQGFEMTEGEQLAYEKAGADLMRQAGMPVNFYNNWHDFTDLIAKGVSPAELGQRINDAYLKVAEAPPAVRMAMQEYYGVRGDAALAAMALDSTKAAPAIMHEVGAAEVGGFLSQQNVKIQKNLAEQMARATANNEALIKQGAEQVGQWNAQGQFNSRFGETPVTAEVGVKAALGGDQSEAQLIQEQIDQRAASMQGGERFDVNQQGVAGLGAPQR